MQRAHRIRRLAGVLDPLAGVPATPVETGAAVDAFAPSLMPRSPRLQGVVMGLGVLGARAATSLTESLTRTVVRGEVPLRGQLVARAVLGGAGAAMAAVPERDGQKLWVASVRSTGQLLRDGSAGGAVHDLGRWLEHRYPEQWLIRPATIAAAGSAGVLYRAGRRALRPDAAGTPSPRLLPGALATSYAVTMAGTGLARVYGGTRAALEAYLGPGPGKSLLARAANAGAWAAGALLAYNAGIARVGRTNQRLEPAYATPPASPGVSGSAESLLPFADLGQEGRRFVTDVVTPELIEEVMGEPAVAEPIRAYVGFNSEPLYQTGRAELALAELARTGAFDRSHLLLVSPTGTGWVDQTMIEAAELLTRGDIATCCIQYARYPSFLSVHKVALGRGQFRLLLWGIKQRLEERPPERRPRVLVFGESLGAWTSSDVMMYQGIQGLDHYGVDRALWVGLPWLAKWSRSGMARGSSTLVPEGTVGVFDRPAQLDALDDEARDRLRAVILSHDNDPIAVMGPDLLVQRPYWLADAERGRGVPAEMRWRPLGTFIQTGMDALTALLSPPGEFGSFGHDYRGDMARFVRHAFHLPHSTEEQLTRIEATLRDLELERLARIEAEHAEAAPPPPAARTDSLAAGVPLRTRRPSRARWLRGVRPEPPVTVEAGV